MVKKIYNFRILMMNKGGKDSVVMLILLWIYLKGLNQEWCLGYYGFGVIGS